MQNVFQKMVELLKYLLLYGKMFVYNIRYNIMENKKKIKITNEIINDAFWLSYIL